MRPPTKQDIARRLKRLSVMMQNLAVNMDYYGGFAPWSIHCEELLGAADLVDQWTREIEKEIADER